MSTSTPAARSDHDLDFGNPPLVEVVIGLQFDPIPGLHPLRLGLYWQSLGPEWSIVTELPPLDQAKIAFGDETMWGTLGIRIGAVKTLRFRTERVGTGEVIQIQNGWFVYNWRKHNEAYPHYNAVLEAFNRHLAAFKTFVEREGLGNLRPNLWEVTYVNQIPRGAMWESGADWPRILPGMVSAVPRSANVTLEDVSGNWDYVIGSQVGRLSAVVSPQKTVPGSHPVTGRPDVLQLLLTARGPIADNDSWRSLEQGLNVGHRSVVDFFTSVTSAEAQTAWGRR